MKLIANESNQFDAAWKYGLVNAIAELAKTMDTDGLPVGQRKVVQFLVEHGIDGTELEWLGKKLIHVAAKRNFASLVQSLIFRHSENLNAVDEDGQTALHKAALHNHTEVARLLIVAEGCNLNAADKSGLTALHCAARRGNTEVARLLIAVEGCDFNAADNDGRTALHYASRRGHTEVARLLIAAEGCNLNAADKNGETALESVDSSAPEIALLIEERLRVQNTLAGV